MLITFLIRLIYVYSTIDGLKIQTSDTIMHSALVYFLKTEKAEFHTYQFREEKLLHIIICNLYPSTEKLISFKKQTSNVLHKINQTRSSLFFVDFVPTSKIKLIF